jgi:hypothetical protein
MANFSAGEVLTAANLNNAINGPSITSATANYTLVLGDAGKLVNVNSASAATVTVPPYSSVAYTAGAAIAVAQSGAGQVTIAAGSGVTINSAGSVYSISEQYGAAQLYNLSTDTWLLIGKLA